MISKLNIYYLKDVWDSGDTDIMIKRLHTKPYNLKMLSNKLEYSISTGVYFTTHAVNVIFCMP